MFFALLKTGSLVEALGSVAALAVLALIRVIGSFVTATINHLQMTFEFDIETAILDEHITFQMRDPDSQCFQQGTHDTFEEVLTGVALVFFFNMNVTIVKHGSGDSFGSYFCFHLDRDIGYPTGLPGASKNAWTPCL